MTRDRLILDLQQSYAAKREENQRIFEERTRAACDKCPGLHELLTARHEALMAGLRRGILSPQKNADANTSLPAAMAVMNRQITDKLVSGGLSEDFLQPVYTCHLCRDEGYLYEPSRHMCSCFEQELNRRTMDALGLNKVNPQTFERFDEALFSPDVVEAYGVSPRQMVRLIRDKCLEYADSFPSTATRDLLFTGKSGLGKTYLLEAIAHRVAQRGFLPLYISAYRMLETARKAYFENNTELMAPLMAAPLLLIDDLGTEPLMANITITQLFALLNERQIAGRRTVISTNLDITELRERYTERITSRLLDSKSCRILHFIGDDVRMRLGR